MSGFLSGLSFANPWLLLGLIALPIIWWLLRVTPPKPVEELFPPFVILRQLLIKEETPDKSPWWLTMIRLLMAGAVIVALSGPQWKPDQILPLDGDVLAIVVDNDWASEPELPALLRTGEALIASVKDRSRPIFLAFSVDDRRELTGPFSPEQALDRLSASSTEAVLPDRPNAVAHMMRNAEEAGIDLQAADLVLLTAGSAGADGGRNILNDAAAWPGDVAIYGSGRALPSAIVGVENNAEGLSVTVERGTENEALRLLARDEDNRIIAEADLTVGQNRTIFELPFELRNAFASIAVEGASHGGSVFLLDENNRRRRIGLLTASNVEDGQPLLAPLYYIRRALEPIADLVEPDGDLFDDNLREVLDQAPSVIVLADIGAMSDNARAALIQWLEAGGTLIRFAGPRLAASVTPGPDPLLPVLLRQGERSLGGALSWQEPQKLTAFPEQSPFFGLSLPREVLVNRQVLAQPTADILERSWATLEDGTPLVTGNLVGQGSLVLFHVAPDATWSNLPISGSFVDILTRLTRLSAGRVLTAANGVDATLPAWQILDGRGQLSLPSRQVAPLSADGMLEEPNFETPPGLYGSEDGYVARNLFALDRLPIAINPEAEGAAMLPLLTTTAMTYTGYLWVLTALFFIADCLGVLYLRGGLRFGSRNSSLAGNASLLLAILFFMLMPKGDATAQAINAEDQAILDQLSQTRLAYVLTRNDDVDATSKAGLAGLSRILRQRTSIEPGEPVAVDIEEDILAFYPMLYFPIDLSAPIPSDEALARLDSYMRQGGTVLFDTRDGLQSGFGGETPEGARLREMVSTLNLPPLEPIPQNHVMTRSFYIIPAFLGRYANATMWVEAQPDGDDGQDRPVRQGDGVSPVLITGNDLAAAWAISETGQALFPTVPPDPLQREYAYRAGVNIIMYMLTGNYKADQVHIPALLERLGQ